MREADLLRADIEMGRFIRSQYSEFKRIGYPRMSAFAKDIAMGTIQPLTMEDPILEVVGAFYSGLGQKEKAVVAWRYLRTDTASEMAKKLSLDKRTLYRWVKRITGECADYLIKYA